MVNERLNGITSGPCIKNATPGLCGQHLKNLHAEHPEFTHLGVQRRRAGWRRFSVTAAWR